MLAEPVDALALVTILRRHGQSWYGQERITQFQHALQCAHLAEQAGAHEALIIAALWHDLGHLVHHLGEDAAVRGIDDGHEVAGAHLLARCFGPEVAQPVRLHVAAKRWLCACEAGYWETLSPASQRSLELQGGPYDDHHAAAFLAQPFADDAIRLRRWDDLAKDPTAVTPDLDHYASLAAQLPR